MPLLGIETGIFFLVGEWANIRVSSFLNLSGFFQLS